MSLVPRPLSTEENENMGRAIQLLLTFIAQSGLAEDLWCHVLVTAHMNMYAVQRGLTPARHAEFLTDLHAEVTTLVNEKMNAYLMELN